MSDKDLNEVKAAVQKVSGCELDAETLREQSTWYSILNIMSLCLGSGMGIPVAQDEINTLFGNIGLCPSDMPIKNPLLLKAIFKNGDPALTSSFDQNDFGSWRWNPDSFDRSIIPQAQGWSIIAETECAKLLGLPRTTKPISPDLWREWNSDSMLFFALAQKQCDFAFDNLRNSNGLFVMQAEQGSIRITDSRSNLEDQVCMLWACSDIASLAGMQDSMNADQSIQTRYIDMANELFECISNNKDYLINNSENKILAQSIAIQALTWYASVTNAQDLRARCLWLLREFADNLVKAEDNSEMVGDSLSDAAAALRGLIEAFRITKLKTYAEKATKIFNFIEGQWQLPAALYMQTPTASEYTYNIDDIGMFAGALNSSRLFLKDRIDKELADFRLRVFFCSLETHAGLQISMPSIDFLPEWLKQREPTEHFRAASVPLPMEAGGDNGIAPVFAGEISYNPQLDTWTRRMIFDTASVMHTCCEFIWLNNQAVNGFPDLNLAEAPLSVRRAAGVEVPLT
ncbi:MAG: hypothetical protein ACYC27_01605 [Armatimonadota bacterium]